MSKDIQVRSGRPSRDSFATRDSFSGLPDLTREMDSWVDHVFSDAFSPFFSPLFQRSNLTPQVRSDVRETKDAYVFSADLPGIPKDKVHIDLDGDVLSISANVNEERSTASETRRSYQRFHQRFTLPSNVDVDRIEAHCEDGLLEVMIPKKASAAAKKIEVQSGKGSIWSRLTGKEEKSEKTEDKSNMN